MPDLAVTWLDDAAHMPVAFAQVREDPLIDRRVVERCSSGADGLTIIQVASGGCTAAVLATLPQVARVHLVDPNPAQLTLARLKLRAMRHDDPTSRAAHFGHASLPTATRTEWLRQELTVLELPEDILGPLVTVAELGPDHSGRYELLFAALRRHLAHVATPLTELLTLDDPAEQQRRVAPHTNLGRALDHAFAEVMSLDHLVRLFGARATGNAVQEFHRHFAGRLRHVLATLPAAGNPWLWQVLRGRHPASHPVDWLRLPRQQALAQITWSNTVMDEALATMTGQAHVVHLSNILDWLSHEEAARTLELARQALRPGGRVIIRQLNSSLDIPALGQGFVWETAEADMLHRQDRSFFYRALHLGRRA